MSALPREVRKKIKQAEKAHEQAYGAGKDGDNEAGNKPPVEPVPAEPAKDDKAPAEQPGDTPAPEEAPKDTAATQAGVEQQPSPDAAPAQPFATQPDTLNEDEGFEAWQHKYKVLGGRYKADGARLRQQITELSGQVSQLQSVLSSIEHAKPPGEGGEIPTTEAIKLLKQEEIDDYGSDLIDVVKRAAREEMAPEVAKLEAENIELKRRMGEAANMNAATARQGVYDTLDTQIPNWRELNSEPTFLTWLDTLDAYTSRLRRELLNEAFETNDAARVVAFFKGYLNEHAAVSMTAEETPAAPVRKAQVDMASLAAPGKPKGGSAPGTQEERQTWRQVEIAAFYKDVQQGKFKNNPKEKLRLEKSIMSAVNSNRIVA